MDSGWMDGGWQMDDGWMVEVDGWWILDGCMDRWQMDYGRMVDTGWMDGWYMVDG